MSTNAKDAEAVPTGCTLNVYRDRSATGEPEVLTQEQIDHGKAKACLEFARRAGRMLARHGGGSEELRAAHHRAGKAAAAPRWHDAPSLRCLGYVWDAVRVDEAGEVIYRLRGVTA